MKKLFRYIRNIFLIIILLIIILTVFTQTRIFKDLLRDKLVTLLNDDVFDSRISINKIDGNIFTSIEIENVRLIKNDSLVISIKKLKVDYDVFSLLKNKIRVHSLIIDSVNFNLVQLQDSSLNISRIFKTSDDTISSPFLWTIILDSLKLRNSTATFSLLDTASVIPKAVKNINFGLNGFYSVDKSIIQLSGLNFNTIGPDVVLKNLLLSAEGNKARFDIKELNIETKFNKISGEGQINLDSLKDIAVMLKTDPLIFSEFNGFIDLGLNGLKPSLNINISKNGSDFVIESIAKETEQSIEIKAIISDNFSKGYSELKLSDINLAKILGDKNLYSSINGSMHLKGHWNNTDDYSAVLEGTLINSRFRDRHISEAKLFSHLKNGDLQSDIYLSGSFGKINVAADINKIFRSPVYSVQSSLKNFNLSRIFLIDSLDSDLNLSITAEFKSFNPEFMTGHIEIVTNDVSRFGKYRIDSLTIKGRKEQNNYLLDSLFIKNQGNKISLKGEYSEIGDIESEVQISMNDYENIRPYILADTLYGNLNLKAKVSGAFDSLKVLGDLELSNFHFDNISVNSLKSNIDGVYKSSEITGDFILLADGGMYDSIFVKTLQIKGNYFDNIFNTDISLTLSDSLQANVVSSLILDSTITIVMPRLNIQNKDNLWQNKNGEISFSTGNNKYLLKNFNLQDDGGSIVINAAIDNKKYLSVDLSLHSFDIKKIMGNFNSDISGLIDLNIKASGQINNPEATGNLKVSEFKVNQYNLGDITAVLNIKDNNLKWDLLNVQPGLNKIRFIGNIPFSISPENLTFNIDEQKEFKAELFIDSFDVANIKLVSDYFDEINGKINCRITASNTLKDPNLKGLLDLSGANLKINKLGIDYRDIKLNLASDLNKIRIESASFLSNKGQITITGYLGSKTNILMGKLDDNNIKLHSTNFELINGKGMNVLLEGDLNLISEGNYIRFDGDFTIPKSSFYLPSLQKTQHGKSSDAPLLVQAVNKNVKIELQDTLAAASQMMSVFSDNINGKIKIRIPDNSWIKSPNINVELKGDLTLEKIDRDVIINGWIRTGRGNLYFYGKKFTINKGELIFKGDKDQNPFVNFTIEYVFRNPAGEKEKLMVDVTNTVKNPIIIFTHNYEVVSERDATSLIMFGIRTENLTQSQQSSMSSNQDLVTNAVAGFLASELSSTLGNKIGLDVLEISGNENWETASLTAGNYVTEDLFVSYERGIPLGNSNEIETNKIITEYELIENLFIQLIGGNSKDSGINIIIEFN